MLVRDAPRSLLKAVRALSRSIVFLWLLGSTLGILAFVSPIPVIILRHYLLPENRFAIPLDFIPKRVETNNNLIDTQAVSLSDLSSFSSLSNENYAMKLVLVLPRNEINLGHGNFAVRAALGFKDWSAHSHSKIDENAADIIERMALMPYKSYLVEHASRILRFPLFVLGLQKEESELEITLWTDAYRPRTKRPHLLITIPKNLWVSSAILKLEVQLTGLRWILKTFPISSFIILSGIIFTMEVTTVLLVLFIIYVQLASHPSAAKLTRIDTKNGHILDRKEPPDERHCDQDMTELNSDVDNTAKDSTLFKGHDFDDYMSFTESDLGWLTPPY